MEEGAKEEKVEKPATEANSPDEEVENKKKKGEKAKEEEEEEEQVEEKISDEKEKKAEGVEKQNEAKEKTDDEKGPSVAKEEVVEKDTKDTGSPKSQMTEKKQKEAKEQKDKEPARKTPISSFFGEEEFAFICACIKKCLLKMCCAFISVRRDSKFLPLHPTLTPTLPFVPLPHFY